MVIKNGPLAPGCGEAHGAAVAQGAVMERLGGQEIADARLRRAANDHLVPAPLFRQRIFRRFDNHNGGNDYVDA